MFFSCAPPWLFEVPASADEDRAAFWLALKTARANKDTQRAKVLEQLGGLTLGTGAW